MYITPIDPPALERLLPALGAIDAALFRELGTAYAEAAWGPEHFRRDLPDKWALSLVACAPPGTPVGYCIASRRGTGAVHVHRLAVSAGARGRGVGRALLTRLEETAGADGPGAITVAAAFANHAAAAVYEALGFERLTGVRLRAHARAAGRPVRVREDDVEEAHGQRYRVFRKRIRATGVSPPPDVSLVFLTYNTRACVERAIRTVLSDIGGFPYTCEMLVVDNASTDGTAEMVARDFPSVRFFGNERNLGAAGGRNRGMRMSRGAFVMLIDSDVYIRSAAVATLVDFLRARPEYAAVSGKMLWPDGRIQPTHSVFPSLAGELFRALFLHRLITGKAAERFTLRNWPYTEEREVDWVGVGCSLVRRVAALEVGLMDEDFFYAGEDADWCYRMRRAGWKVGIVPAAEAVHVGSQSVRSNVGGLYDKPLKGRLRFFEKHYGPGYAPVLRALALVEAGAMLLASLALYPWSRARRQQLRWYIACNSRLLWAFLSGRV